MNRAPETPLVLRDRRMVVLWLCLCALMVCAMVLVGGYTRLSGSGLSITDWKPVHGIIPPLNAQEWTEEFNLYRASPQYQQVNKGMSLEEFKVIFWPEYWHRVLGRVVGFIFLLPMLVFMARRSISYRAALRLSLIFALGGLQGFIGWFMVKSGLVDDPYVSPIKLALHLSNAFLIFCCIVWLILDITRPWSEQPHRLKRSKLRVFYALLGLTVVQIVYGAFVAGLKAGLIFNSFPTMSGEWIPAGMGNLSPWHENLHHNVTTVQFIHRWNAIFLLFCLPIWWHWAKPDVISKNMKKAGLAMILVLAVQFILGVLTLINQVPMGLALKHQMTALLLLATMVALLHAIRTGSAHGKKN